MGYYVEIPADNIGRILARFRPPEHQLIDVRLDPKGAEGIASFADTMRTVLHAIVTDWPAGTVFVAAFDDDMRYVQGMHYPTSWLIEFGRQDPETMRRATAAGWIDPEGIPAGHADFDSQIEWQNNLLQELDWQVDGLPKIAAELEKAAFEYLGAAPEDVFGLQIFFDNDDRDPDEDVVVVPTDEFEGSVVTQ